MRLAPGVLAALAVILALVVVDTCARRSERAKLEARMRDRRDDSTVARLAAELLESEKAFRRARDSTGRVIRGLQAKIASVPKLGTNVPNVGTNPELLPDSRDSLLAALTAGRTQDSLQILFWKAQVAARDSIIPRLQQARDSWRREASKPRHTVTDISGGFLLGVGLARESGVTAGVGGALILLPRALDALGRIF